MGDIVSFAAEKAKRRQTAQPPWTTKGEAIEEAAKKNLSVATLLLTIGKVSNLKPRSADDALVMLCKEITGVEYADFVRHFSPE